MGCGGQGVDMSDGLFEHFAPLSAGTIYIDWLILFPMHTFSTSLPKPAHLGSTALLLLRLLRLLPHHHQNRHPQQQRTTKTLPQPIRLPRLLPQRRHRQPIPAPTLHLLPTVLLARRALHQRYQPLPLPQHPRPPRITSQDFMMPC